MLTVTQVKLAPTSEMATALQATLVTCNREANRLSELAFHMEGKSRRALQAAAYPALKAAGLSAQPALHVIRKVADAYTALAANIRAGNLGKSGSKRRAKVESKPIVFRPEAAQSYDDRCLSWQLNAKTVSIWTTAGRLKNIPFACSPETLKALREYRKGETDLVMRDGAFYLMATCDVPEAATFEPTGWIGVDLGIVNIATTSTGYRAAGRGLNRHRERMRDLRAKLQKKGTKSAKRALKRLSRRESRRARDTNHVIAKRIVTEAERTTAGIGLEDLSGIRQRARLRKPQRVALHSWAFAQLGSFVAYKAKRAGVPLVYVDPAYTSQTCADCGHTDKKNRPGQATFACRSCGVVAHADRNASRNIAHRAESAWNAGRQSSAPVAAP
ncbi:RNA-guided endonuclease InsQ/TnpB family protein [Kitasatospora xanthocidica]|uniref:RNA-guided endonuclease InsQ/TnpB family protein n=1 Tax=Kitasatospora xanthocidica TaxID=83382 RepID=UPI0036F0FA08